jgi:hydrogenase maturation protein HypF
LVNESGCERFADLRTFRLPGGDAAVKEPRRATLGLLFAAFGEEAFAMKHLAPVAAFSEAELKALRQMLVRGVNSPVTSSAGRLFDAVAALVGVRQRASFEGQAAMELEWAIGSGDVECGATLASSPHDGGVRRAEEERTSSPRPSPPSDGGEGEDGANRSLDSRIAAIGPSAAMSYELRLTEAASPALSSAVATPTPLVLDWQPVLDGILNDLRSGAAATEVSRKFHNALAEAIVAVARRAGRQTVALSGGCFQNLYLAEQTILRLRESGFQPLWHRFVPPNDGGIALGQMAAVVRRK